MNDALVAGAGEMVEAGIRETGIPLTVELKHYLAITVARYMREEIEVDRLTIRVARAIDERASRDVLRSLADQCLVACSVFERRLRRGGGSLHHYVGLGRVAYDAASMTPQAWGFSGMRDVLATASGMRASNRMQDLIDAARSGSEIARDTLAQANVVVFKGGSLLR